MTQEALKLALEALEDTVNGCICRNCINQVEVITAIKEALAQPEPFKPDWNTEAVLVEEMQRMAKRIEELEVLAQRPWVGLTDEEITNALKKYQGWREFAAELDAILERKNAAGSQAFYGFPTEPVSTPNAGGKCVTAGETAP